jgi:hypothetical protein
MEMRRSHVAGKVRHLWLDLLRDRPRDDVGVVNYRVTGTGVSVSWVVMLCMVMMHTSWEHGRCLRVGLNRTSQI